MKLFKKHTAGMKKYKEFKKCIGMIGKIEESADVKEAALTAGYIIGVVRKDTTRDSSPTACLRH